MNFIPNFKGYDLFPHDLRLPFMRFKGLALGASIVAMSSSETVGRPAGPRASGATWPRDTSHTRFL